MAIPCSTRPGIIVHINTDTKLVMTKDREKKKKKAKNIHEPTNAWALIASVIFLRYTKQSSVS